MHSEQEREKKKKKKKKKKKEARLQGYKHVEKTWGKFQPPMLKVREPEQVT